MSGRGLFDYIVVNNQPAPGDVMERYAQEGAEQVRVDWDNLRKLEGQDYSRQFLQTGLVAWHNPRRFGAVFVVPHCRRILQTVQISGPVAPWKPSCALPPRREYSSTDGGGDGHGHILYCSY